MKLLMDLFQSNQVTYKPYHNVTLLQEMPLLDLKLQTSLSYVGLKLEFGHCLSIIFCYHQALYSLIKSIKSLQVRQR